MVACSLFDYNHHVFLTGFNGNIFSCCTFYLYILLGIFLEFNQSDRKQVFYLLQLALAFVFFGFIFHRSLWFLGLLVIFVLPFRKLRSLFIKFWDTFGIFISKLTHPVFLGMLYFIILTPIAFIWRLFGHHPLNLRRPLKSTLEVVDDINEPKKFEKYW